MVGNVETDRYTMKRSVQGYTVAALLILTPGALCETLFETDFENVPPGEPPPAFTALEGRFTVREQDNNMFIESPDHPVEAYSLLFGPTVREDVSATARVFGTATGRRYPAFALGLHGAAGYRLKVAPGKRKIELWKGDENKAGAPFIWQPGRWLWLRLELVKIKEDTWRIRGKVWPDGTDEPSGWLLNIEDNTAPRSGRATVFAYPIAGTPIWYDNLKVERIAP